MTNFEAREPDRPALDAANDVAQVHVMDVVNLLIESENKRHRG